jgi:hypothetical protein
MLNHCVTVNTLIEIEEEYHDRAGCQSGPVLPHVWRVYVFLMGDVLHHSPGSGQSPLTVFKIAVKAEPISKAPNTSADVSSIVICLELYEF